jgi:PPK2 family polyphosphate:nucleotide phosphotransferase
MKIDIDDFRVDEDTKVKLRKWPTEVQPYYESKDHYEKLLADHVDSLRKLQPILYAHDRYALLVIFQAMDAGGKDSVIKHVMSGVNPQGCQVYSFKHPGPEVLDHDFLWQAARLIPERGRIGIFNRSYYEEVLIVRVHPELLDAQKLPKETLKRGSIWKKRYKSIRNFEQHLHANGTRIVKFYLHLSKEEQRKRFLSRLEEPEKNWKFNEGDLRERACWDAYMDAYEHCLAATSTREAPWYIVPADDKPNARLIISKVIIDTLRSIPMSYPKLEANTREALDHYRRALEAEAPGAQQKAPDESARETHAPGEQAAPAVQASADQAPVEPARETPRST